jgi:hypothetical protein
MYIQLYPLPIFCFSSNINSKMPSPKRKAAKPKTTPPSSPPRAAKAKRKSPQTAAAAKRKNPPTGSKSSPKKTLNEAPVPVVTTRSKTPSPDTTSHARGSQASGTEHTITSVDIQTADNPNDQEELTTTMEGGRAATERSASVAYTHLDKKTSDHSAVIAVIRNYVTHHFFPYVKFITSNKKLAYYEAKGAHPYTYCSVITKGCNLPPNTDPINWCGSP